MRRTLSKAEAVTRLVLQGWPHDGHRHAPGGLAADDSAAPQEVLEKTGVRSRRELIGKVFFAHYEPRVQRQRAAGAGRSTAPRRAAGSGRDYLSCRSDALARSPDHLRICGHALDKCPTDDSRLDSRLSSTAHPSSIDTPAARMISRTCVACSAVRIDFRASRTATKCSGPAWIKRYPGRVGGVTSSSAPCHSAARPLPDVDRCVRPIPVLQRHADRSHLGVDLQRGLSSAESRRRKGLARSGCHRSRGG